jgi:uncharacterized membrane protein YphA (DoxX/SURF4 family)
MGTVDKQYLMKRRLVTGLAIVLRLVIGCIFVASSISKLRQPYDFLASVYGYELVGPKLGVIVAIVLPWLELLAGVCLVGGIFVAGALLASIGMCAMFSFVLASALWRGLEISCGCFNPSSTSVIGYWSLIRAATLLLAAAAAYAYAVSGARGTGPSTL